MLADIRAIIAGLPADAGGQIIGVNAPPFPFIPEEYHFQPGCMLAIVGWGSPEEHAAMVAPAREGVPPLFEFITPLPCTMLQQMIDESAPWGILAYEKACYLDDLTDDAIAVIAEQLPRKASPMSIMPVFPMGGAITSPPTTTPRSAAAATRVARQHLCRRRPIPQLLVADRGGAHLLGRVRSRTRADRAAT